MALEQHQSDDDDDVNVDGHVLMFICVVSEICRSSERVFFAI